MFADIGSGNPAHSGILDQLTQAPVPPSRASAAHVAASLWWLVLRCGFVTLPGKYH